MGSRGGANRGVGKTAIVGRTISQSDVATLQKAMGQTGEEAGRVTPFGDKSALYVKTSKAFNINAYLNSDGKTIHSDLSSWDSIGYTKRMVQNDIKRIDSGMKPLTENINTVRFIGPSALEKMFPALKGINDSNVQQFISSLESDAAQAKDFKKVLKGSDYTHKGYTSTTYIQNHPAFDTRDIRIDSVMRKGTPAIVTNNHAEHEIVGGRNLKYNFTGDFEIKTVKDKFGRTKKQLVLKAYY